MEPDRTLCALVGHRLLAYRHAAGLTQQQVAERIDVTQPALSQWERGLHDIPFQAVVRLAAVFLTTVDAILSADDLPRDVYLRASRGPEYLA